MEGQGVQLNKQGVQLVWINLANIRELKEALSFNDPNKSSNYRAWMRRSSLSSFVSKVIPSFGLDCFIFILGVEEYARVCRATPVLTRIVSDRVRLAFKGLKILRILISLDS
jgi:hypothetical protein